MNLNEMKTKEWKEKRARLESALQSTNLLATRITRGDGYIVLEGGALPALFDFKTQELILWGRGSRYAGARMSVSELIVVQDIVRKWYREELRQDDEGAN